MSEEVLDENIRLFFFGNDADVPNDWSRDTDFDDRYLIGAPNLEDPGGNGGSATHTHTATGAHKHNNVAHNHTLSVSGAAAGALRVDSTGLILTNTFADSGHTHSSASNVNSQATMSTTTPTFDAAAMEPLATTAIIIGPNDPDQVIPRFAVVFLDHSTIPTDWKGCDGNNGTPDLADQYIVGAGTGADGGAGSGAADHTHTSPSHGHTFDVHTHFSADFGASSAATFLTYNFTVKGNAGVQSVHHNTGGPNNTTISTANTAITVQTATNDYKYVKLYPIMKMEDGADDPEGFIVPFIGTIAQIPAGFRLCDGGSSPDLREGYVKGTISNGSIGVAGGSNTHLHICTDHAHTDTAHNHTFTETRTNTIPCDVIRAGTNEATSAHTHTSYSIDNTTTTTENAVVQMFEADGRAPYREVLWIKRQPTTVLILGKTTILGSTKIL